MSFAFLVHPLVGWHRVVLAVRTLNLRLLAGKDVGVDAVGVTARLRFETAKGPVEGWIVSVPDLPGQLVADQGRALALQERAARIAIAQGARVVGLGSALAVVAGRGQALADAIEVPVTTGHASTSWATAAITREVLADRGIPKGPVGVIGFKGPVGDAVAGILASEGVEVWADATGRAARRAEKIGVHAAERAEVAGRCDVLVGAATTGPVLAPSALREGATIVDLALPPTLERGPRPPGVSIVAGETVALPGPLRAGLWGRIWLLLAAYGPGVVYACLAEPAALALTGEAPWSAGRRLDPQQVQAAGRALTELGFRPVLRRRRLG